MGAVDCLEMNTDEGKYFKIHRMKETYCVMKLMVSWMKLKDLEGANTKREWKNNGVWKSKTFVYKNLLVYNSSSSQPASVSRWNAHSRTVVLHTLHRGQRDNRLCPLTS